MDEREARRGWIKPFPFNPYPLTSHRSPLTVIFHHFMEKKLSYIIAVISEFAQAHTLNLQQAYRYLMRYKGLEFIDQHYDIEHTLPFEDVIEDLTAYCKTNGGAIV